MSSPIKFGVETQYSSKEFNWDETAEIAESMLKLAELGASFEQEQQRRQRKLEKFPKGFHLEGRGYSCAICGDSCSEEETWYDQYGIKCMPCQKAIDQGDIPAYCAENKESWYSRYDMESDFNVNRFALRRWIKAGILKARTLERERREDVQILLIEDNKDMLPPKELVESECVHERGDDGKTWFHIEPWYRFVDPYQHLKGYKIMDHLEMKDGKLQPKGK